MNQRTFYGATFCVPYPALFPALGRKIRFVMIAGYGTRKRLNRDIDALLTTYIPLAGEYNVSGYRASIILRSIARVFTHGGVLGNAGPRATIQNILIYGIEHAMKDGSMTEDERGWFWQQAFNYMDREIDPLWAGENFAAQVHNARTTLTILRNDLDIYGYSENIPTT